MGTVADARDGQQPTESLIQQRIRLGRERAFGVLYIVVGALGFGLGVAIITSDPSRWTSWAMSITWLGMGGLGVRNLVRYAGRKAAFEGVHGVGAGQQQAVSAPRSRPAAR